MIKLIGIILLCFAAVTVIVIFDARPSRIQPAEAKTQLAEIAVLQTQLEDISTDSERLSALFRKIDGGQSTDEQAMEATTVAIDLALKDHGLTTINELRDHLLMLDSMYSATLEEIRFMKVNPKRRNLKKPK